MQIYYDYINNLNPNIIYSIKKYTSMMYDEINDYLIDNLFGTDYILDNIINNIDSAFTNAPELTESLVVYRGIDLPNITGTRGKLLLGEYKGKYKGYISTSLDINVSDQFMNINLDKYRNPSKCCLFSIILPIGTKCLFIENISKVKEEKEILLPRNSIISIVSLSNGIIHGKLELN